MPELGVSMLNLLKNGCQALQNTALQNTQMAPACNADCLPPGRVIYLTASLAKHSRTLKENRYFNGHPDLIVHGVYPGDAVKAGTDGVEIKTTRKAGGAVDTHGAREQWMCVFVYDVDSDTEPAINRRPMAFTEVYLGHVSVEDFRKNPRGELGTRTATLHRDGIQKLRGNWIYRL
jgi:hypothetical protein